MAIADQIESIIRQRENDIRPRFEQLWSKAKPVIDFAYKLEKLVNSDEWKLLLAKNPIVSGIWKKEGETIARFINIVKERIGEPKTDDEGNILQDKNGETKYCLSDNLDAVFQRVNKNEVEVCIMGPISTGKSVLMQGLTGAPNYVIPDGTGKTTAARTTFKNISNVENSKADIHFYTKDEFVAIFNNYITKLNLATIDKTQFPLWDGISSLAAFCETLKNNPSFISQNFPSSEIPGVPSLILATEYFATFNDLYVKLCPDYEASLGHEDVHLVKDQIEAGQLVPYVSYKKVISDKKVTSGLALAVKEVEVYWPLSAPNGENLGKINLVDTMGIGEPKFAVEDNLLNVIRKRADLAIALCRVLNAQDDFEANHKQDKLFLKVVAKLRKRNPENWVYYLANDTAGVNISPEIENSLRDDLWNFMGMGADGFSLNKDNWRAFEFMLKSKNNQLSVNRAVIIDYFTSVVLSNLERDIKKIDKQFIGQAENDYNEAIAYLPKLELLFVKTDNETIDVTDEESVLSKSTEQAMNNIAKSLKNECALISKENYTHCQKIINEIYPLLCNPELFTIYGINIPDDKNLFKSYESNSGNEKLKDQRFREVRIFIILNEMNSYRVDPMNHCLSFEEAKKRFIDDVEKNDKWKDEKDVFEELLKNEFFETIYNESSDAIKDSQNSITPQIQLHDIQNKAVYENLVGRELQFFYETREKILYGILKRLDTTDSQNAQDSLAAYFTETTKDVLNRISKVIFDVLVKEHVIGNNTSQEFDYAAWLSGFARKSKGKKLSKSVEKFLDTKINLNEIVIHQQADTLLDNLCQVHLSYNDPRDAAYSFFSCLFNIDRRLRYTLWQMYVKTFEDFGIYTPSLDMFQNTVFCTKSGLMTEKTDEYREFYNIVKTAKQEVFGISEEGKLVTAKVYFDDCYNSLQKTTVLWH